MILKKYPDVISVLEKLREGIFSQLLLDFFSRQHPFRFPRVAEVAWMESNFDEDINKKLPVFFSNIKAALITRIEAVDYLSKNTTNNAIQKIKQLQRIFFAFNDDVLSNLFRSAEVHSSLYLKSILVVLHSLGVQYDR